MLLVSTKKTTEKLRPALFLDRDGIINKDYGYVCVKENFHFTDHIFDLIAAARLAGYLVVVVTNQAGIGRGLYTLHEFKVLTEWMCKQCANRGADIDAVFFSPFHPTEAKGEYLLDENTRKPNPGMIFEAVSHLNINLTKSVMVGDNISDVQASIAACIPNNFLFIPEIQIVVPTELENKVKCVSSLTEIIPLL